MLFWIISIAMTLLAGIAVILPLWRSSANVQTAGPTEASTGGNDVDIYKAQLAEIDRDLARGVLSAEDAERTRIEISRRLLAADKAASKTDTVTERPARLVAGVAMALLLVGSVVTYALIGAPGAQDVPLTERLAQADIDRANRPSQLDMEARVLAERGPLPEPDISDDYRNMITELRSIVPSRPDDIEGWRLLARHEAALLQYPAAAAAQARVVQLAGVSVSVVDQVQLVDMMVAATSGFVSPEAEFITRQILEREPNNIAGLYYMGLLYDTTDRPDLALRIWRPIAETGSLDSIHVRLARQLIDNAAYRAGSEYRLPERPDTSVAGPSSADIDAAADLSNEDRQAMIIGMVNQLSDRLASQGGTPEEWAQLIAALAVLGETAQASGILTEGRAVFASNPAALTLLNDTAERAGLGQ